MCYTSTLYDWIPTNRHMGVNQQNILTWLEN